ncbi:hypothetical protein BGX29_000572 [Mortierella sp. GBA35]|nr:hypothetical protein BGX29_000572 [Mortierella sp. GBA35]
MPAPVLSFHRTTRLPKLIVTDLDGTLLNPQHTISQRSIKALSLAQSYYPSTITTTGNASSPEPIQIMIASGRSPRSIQKVIDLFGGAMIPDAVICCNGALNYNPRTKTISVPQFLPLDQTLAMVQTLRSEIQDVITLRSLVPAKSLPPVSSNQDQLQELTHLAGRPGFACEVIWFLNPQQHQQGNGEQPVYARDTSFVCDRVWEEERKHSIYYDYTVVDESMESFIQSLQGRGGIVKLMALDRNRTASKVYESLPSALLHPTAPTTPSTLSTSSSSLAPPLTLTYSGPYFLEISAGGVNKGLGLSKYCEANGIARGDVVAFGDLLNDAEMLQFAGLGLCMGNGHEDMKRLADRVIGTNAEDGLAQEVESWFA